MGYERFFFHYEIIFCYSTHIPIEHQSMFFLFKCQAQILIDATCALAEREIVGLHTESVASCSSFSHTIEGQNSESTDIYFANFGYF